MKGNTHPMKDKPLASKSCCGREDVVTVPRKDILDKLDKLQALFKKAVEHLEKMEACTQNSIDLLEEFCERHNIKK